MQDRAVLYNSATCPRCGQSHVWNVATPPTTLVRCTNEIEIDRKTRKTCGHKMPRHDWDYLAEREERRVSGE